jgi:hypothetical protein
MSRYGRRYLTGFHMYVQNKYRTEGTLFLKDIPRTVVSEKMTVNPYV